MNTFARGVIALALALGSLPLGANDAPAPEDAVEAAFDAAAPAMQHGPATVTLRDQATLKLPEGYVFIPQEEAGAILTAMGNSVDEQLVGMILGKGEGFSVIDYVPSGYIEDKDARDWNVEDMLAALKAGTEQQNEVRRQRQMPELEIVGWVEEPRYDPAAHQLVWSLSSRHKGSADDADLGINYNTYALGREGYLNLNLVTGLAQIPVEKAIAQELLDGIAFNDGKRYSDFNPATDTVAAHGLAALVGGVAAKKLGLFAVMAAVLAKSWKLALVAVVAVGALVRKWATGRKQPA